MKKNTIRLTESELKHIINETVNQVLNEGTNLHTDGMVAYQGVGTPESKKRVSQIKKKNNYRGAWTNWDRAKNYDGFIGDTNASVARMLWQLSNDVAKAYDDVIAKLEKSGLTELVERLQSLKDANQYLDQKFENEGLLKRDFYGEPNKNYKGDK